MGSWFFYVIVIWVEWVECGHLGGLGVVTSDAGLWGAYGVVTWGRWSCGDLG